MRLPPLFFREIQQPSVYWIHGLTTNACNQSRRKIICPRQLISFKLETISNCDGLPPITEVGLCGHATLASAFVMFLCRDWNEDTIRFQTRKSGQLTVARKGERLEMDFPARPVHPKTPPDKLGHALGVVPEKVYGSAEDLMIVLDSEKTVMSVKPDFAALKKIDCRGIIITAKGDRCDFVSRFFAPRVGVPEDPVTGSAHCVLIPYWATVLGKKELKALQVSKRGGELFCGLAGERVRISGKAALYLEGTITI